MKISELRKIIREEVKKTLNEGALKFVGSESGFERVWTDGTHYYTVATGPIGQYKFIVFEKGKKGSESFYVKNDLAKIKASPYYDAYKEVRDRWDPDPYGQRDSLFGY